MKIKNLLIILFFPLLTACPTVVDEERVEKDYFIDERDGNKYSIVKIGNQTWFAEDLRYVSNTKFIENKEDWSSIYLQNTKVPAHTISAIGSTAVQTVGPFYKWFAVQTGFLCPNGWKIPTEHDFRQLADNLGGLQYGTKLKSKTGWGNEDISEVERNLSGFDAKANGRIDNYGRYDYFEEHGYWWTSTKVDHPTTDLAVMMSLNQGGPEMNIQNMNVEIGFACRCLKD